MTKRMHGDLCDSGGGGYERNGLSGVSWDTQALSDSESDCRNDSEKLCVWLECFACLLV